MKFQVQRIHRQGDSKRHVWSVTVKRWLRKPVLYLAYLDGDVFGDYDGKVFCPGDSYGYPDKDMRGRIISAIMQHEYLSKVSS